MRRPSSPSVHQYSGAEIGRHDQVLRKSTVRPWPSAASKYLQGTHRTSISSNSRSRRPATFGGAAASSLADNQRADAGSDMSMRISMQIVRYEFGSAGQLSLAGRAPKNMADRQFSRHAASAGAHGLIADLIHFQQFSRSPSGDRMRLAHFPPPHVIGIILSNATLGLRRLAFSSSGLYRTAAARPPTLAAAAGL